MNRWLLGAVVLGAVVGLAAWIVVDRTTGGGNTSASAAALIDEFNAAVSSKNRHAAARLLLVTDFDAWSNGETFGPSELVDHIATRSTLRLRRDAPVVTTGGFNFTFAKTGVGRLMEVFQSQDGKLRRLWLIVPGRDAPFDIAVGPRPK